MIKTSEKMRHQAEKARTFVQHWVLSNMNSTPDVRDIAREADRLASLMTGDARSFDISGVDIARAVGNIDDYLTAELEKRQRTPGLNAS
jgi:hypothetical protein